MFARGIRCGMLGWFLCFMVGSASAATYFAAPGDTGAIEFPIANDGLSIGPLESATMGVDAPTDRFEVLGLEIA